MTTERKTTRAVELSTTGYGFSFDGETLTVAISSTDSGDTYEIEEDDRLALIWMLTIPELDGVDDLGSRDAIYRDKRATETAS